MKIKRVKMKCPVCGSTGSCQLFLNRTGRIRYAKVRHYSHIDKVSKKPQFIYCKLEDLQALKTLLLNKGISLSTDKVDSGQIGQNQTGKIRDLKLKHSSLNSLNKWASSSARIEHHPPKSSKNIDPSDINMNLGEYREFLLSKFSRSYALQLFNNGIKHSDFLENPQGISAIPSSTRGNVLKAMVNLAKYAGTYEEYKVKLKNHGIKWINNDNAFNSFLRIVNNSHSNLGAWYKTAQSILRDNEKLYLKFTLLSGLRKDEAINSFNLIVKLAKQNKLSEYYSEKLGILEHFKYGNLFLRQTKKVYISIVTKELVSEIANNQPVSYSAIRKRLARNKLNLRIKELRSYFATHLRKKGIISEYIDLMQGRIPKSVFARHYLKVEDVKELVAQVLAVTDTMESSLLS
jgi:intergrase/recombinase